MRCRRPITRCCRTRAGCYNAEDAVRTLRLARELLDGHALMKLEVLGDPQSLYPEHAADDQGRRDAGQRWLRGHGLLQRRPDPGAVLESIGCVAVMPLASLIGSGMGILNPWNMQLILEACTVPVHRRCRRRHRE